MKEKEGKEEIREASSRKKETNKQRNIEVIYRMNQKIGKKWKPKKSQSKH